MKTLVYQGVCIDVTNQGMGVIKIDSFPFFLDNVLEGEEVTFAVTKRLSKYGFGKVIKYHVLSEKRIDPICPHYNMCGGCNLMHLNYFDQIEFKKAHLEKILNRPLDSFIACDKTLRYRNKIIFRSKNNQKALLQSNSHTLVPIKECLLVSKDINLVADDIVKQLKPKNDIVIKQSFDSKEIMSNYDNKLFIIDSIGDVKYRISLESFFQVNTKQTKKLYDEVIKAGEFNNEDSVLDLYCGVGSIGLYIAQYVNSVMGVEINAAAIKNANENKVLNNTDNIEFVCQDATEFIHQNKSMFNKVVVDPPRAGLTKQGIDDLLVLSPERMVYVSCNPMTLKRDLQRLTQFYEITYCVGVDLFPQTHHVETVVGLTRKNV